MKLQYKADYDLGGENFSLGKKTRNPINNLFNFQKAETLPGQTSNGRVYKRNFHISE